MLALEALAVHQVGFAQIDPKEPFSRLKMADNRFQIWSMMTRIAKDRNRSFAIEQTVQK